MNCRVELTRSAAPSTGELRLNTIPWSELSLNGVPYGPTHWSGELAAGTYHAVFLRPDGARHEVRFKLDAGETVLYCWDFLAGTACRG